MSYSFRDYYFRRPFRPHTHDILWSRREKVLFESEYLRHRVATYRARYGLQMALGNDVG